MRQLFSSIPGQVLDFIVVLIGLVIIFKTRITGEQQCLRGAAGR